MTAFRPHLLALKLFVGILVLWAVALVGLLAYAQMPDEAAGTAIVLFPPSWETEAALAAAQGIDARLVTTTAFDNIIVVAQDTPGLVGRLKEAGALMAFRNLTFGDVTFAGCLGGDLRSAL